MRGRPHAFMCPVKRRGRRKNFTHPLGHDVVRTGRTKPNRSRKMGAYGIDESHEYRCSCGHVGWSTHPDIIWLPIES